MLSNVSDDGSAYGNVGASAGESARTATAMRGATVKSEITANTQVRVRWRRFSV
jgi:hypothetical protein